MGASWIANQRMASWFVALLLLNWIVIGCGNSEKATVTPRRPTDQTGAAPAQTSHSGAESVASPTQPTDSKAGSKAPAIVSGEAALNETQRNRATQLYVRHCAACHGEKGDGNSVAARFLFPKPRNFRAGSFRLVSTTNGVPTIADIQAVLTRGMPGSAMPPWPQLNDADRTLLAEQLIEFRREGIRERERAMAVELGEEVDEAEVKELVAKLTTPGTSVAVPKLREPHAEAIARGKELYLTKGCASCHGNEGRGDGAQKQVDADGFPTRPRDLTKGIFKGSPDPAAVYIRTRAGMPGTPMPASPQLVDEEVAELVHFVLSLSDEQTRAATVLNRQRLVAASMEKIPAAVGDNTWDEVLPAEIRVTPLWWRDHDDPHLQVQAVHDAESLAIRVSWLDTTQDDLSVRPQDFEDMMAVQLFRGENEPFLGMGAADGSVDVWLWKAAWQADRVRYGDVDARYPNMVVDTYPFATDGDGPDAFAIQRQPKDFLSGWAAGNLASDPNRQVTAGTLQAKGFGTLTMLPRVSQVVTADGVWNSGRWTVVLRRPLRLNGDDGLTLTRGDKLSAAFAIWNGAAGERDGQKLISIWQDLEIEK